MLFVFKIVNALKKENVKKKENVCGSCVLFYLFFLLAILIVAPALLLPLHSGTMLRLGIKSELSICHLSFLPTVVCLLTQEWVHVNITKLFLIEAITDFLAA